MVRGFSYNYDGARSYKNEIKTQVCIMAGLSSVLAFGPFAVCANVSINIDAARE